MNQNSNYSTNNAVSQSDLSLFSETQATDPRLADINYQQGFRGRGFGRGFPRSRPGGRGLGFRGRGGDNRSTRLSDCEYCYVQAKVHGKNVDFRHNVRSCPLLKHMFQSLLSVNVAEELYEEEQVHPFDIAFIEYETQASFPVKDGGMFGKSQ